MLKIVLMDIDGVLTDGKVIVDSIGNESKSVNFKDIDAIYEMKNLGLKVGLVTGEATPITKIFEKYFKPDFFYNGCKDKTTALKEILEQTEYTTEQVCYVGDGKFDVPILKKVKWAACPSNAIFEVKEVANILLDYNGGDGCAWELLEWIKTQKILET
jgi:YrbI family 3-deoxy-D-manno-octulosonate 8-phosphate phosphatase